LKKSLQPTGQPSLLDLAFPHSEYSPPEPSKPTPNILVSHDVAQKLWNPVALVSLRDTPELARVLMPKTAMNEDYPLLACENDVGLSWNVGAMQTEAIPERV
jgi:hypothetical protein